MTKIQITNPLSEETKQEIVKAAAEYFNKNKGVGGFTMEDFYKTGSSVTKSDWSYMRKGAWNKVVTKRNDKEVFSSIKDAKFIKLGKAIGLVFEKDYWQHFDTDNYALIVTTLDKARHTKKPHAIDGDTGLGKTYSINQYYKLCPGETYIVTCDGDMSVKDFYVELAEVFGIKHAGLSKFKIRKQISKELKRKSNALLIIDEAENLKDGVYDGIKALMDSLKGICGIVLFGANSYENTLAKKASKNKGCFPQIYSRIKEGGFTQLFKMELTDVRNVCKAMNIKDNSVINILAGYAANMRELSGAVQDLLKEADDNNTPISADLTKTILS